MVSALALLSLLSVPADVETTLRGYVEATRTYDVRGLDRLLHPEYEEISPLGDVDGRAKVLSFYRVKPASGIPDAFRIEDLAVRFPARDVAVARYRLAFTASKSEFAFRASAVLRRDRGRWRLYHLQATALRPRPKTAPGGTR